MEWCLSRYEEDGIVPKNQRTSEQICEDEPLSLDDWPQNEMSAFENLTSPTKRFYSGNVRHEQGFLWDRPDYQLQQLCQNCPDQMDENTLNSLAHEDLRVVEDPYHHEDLTTDYSGSFGNLLSAMIADKSSTSKDLSTLETEYTRTSKLPFTIFEEPDIWDEKACSPSLVDTVTAEVLFKKKVPMLTILAHSELNVSTSTSLGLREDDSSEESVLDELEFVLKQFKDETRICFRDAFYRLAESSRQRSAEGESRWDNFAMEIASFATVDGQGPCFYRSRSSEALDSLESETNVIDRTIMSLLFNKVIFAYSDLSSPLSS